MKAIPAEVRQKCYWYRESPRALLGNMNIMKLNAAERGIYFSLRLHAWEKGTVPCNYDDLAFLTRLEPVTLEQVVPKLISSGLVTCSDDGHWLYMPELEEMMVQAVQSLEKKKEGGRKGGRRSAEQRSARTPTGHRSDRSPHSENAGDTIEPENDEGAESPAGGGPQGIPQPRSSSVISSSQILSVKKGHIRKEFSDEQAAWVADFERNDPDFIKRGNGRRH